MLKTLLLVFCAVSLLVSSAPAQSQGEEGKGVPKIIKKVNPTYPPDAKNEKVEGAVTLDIKINENGKVTEAKASKSPDERLSKAAIDAVKQWEFEPAKVDGKPVTVKASIHVNFRLQ